MQYFIIQIFALLFLLSSSFLSFSQETLKRAAITKEISMSLPASLTPMGRGDQLSRYVSSRTPIAMFTTDDRQTDLGINETVTPWADGDLEILQSFYKAGILNLFTEVTFYQEEIRQIGDREFIVFEFVSRITDEESAFGGTSSISRYNYLQYTLRNSKVLLFNFSCPARARNEWQATAKEMMESIRLKN